MYHQDLHVRTHSYPLRRSSDRSDSVLVRRVSPEGLYGRRKMTAYLRRTAMPEASAGSVDRSMRTLGLSGVRRDKGVRTTIPAKDGTRAGALLDRDFPADRKSTRLNSSH